MKKQKIAVVGLGKMGRGLICNLRNKNYDVAGFDINESACEDLRKQKIDATNDIKTLASFFKQDERKLFFLMLPAGKIVDDFLDKLLPFLNEHDCVIDAGNSFYKDSIARYERLQKKHIAFLDCGTSGGPSGALNGACTMIGGDENIYKEFKTIFDDISVEGGSLYVGKAGSGHFVKMVHNGIEYGMMQAIAEGYEVLFKSPYTIDLEKVSALWNHGSVIRSWLIELMESIFSKSKNLENVRGVMNASGEGKWTVETALELKVPVPVIALSLMMRDRSLDENAFAGKIIASLRNEFGGHEILKAKSF